MDPLVFEDTIRSRWLTFPDDGAPLSEDGKALTGSHSYVDGFGSTVDVQWDLHAEREE